MADERLLDPILQRELETMRIMLWGKAMRTSITLEEHIKVRMLQGTSMEAIKVDLLKDLHEGGRIFGEFRNSVKATVNGSLGRLRDDAEFSDLGVITDYRWSAVLINTCDDCISRHGQVKKWEEWEKVGMPRTGATVCGANCKCVLLPAEASELEPIRRGKK